MFLCVPVCKGIFIFVRLLCLSTGFNGAVPKLSANRLEGTGFALLYLLQLIVGFKGPLYPRFSH